MVQERPGWDAVQKNDRLPLTGVGVGHLEVQMSKTTELDSLLVFPESLVPWRHSVLLIKGRLQLARLLASVPSLS